VLFDVAKPNKSPVKLTPLSDLIRKRNGALRPPSSLKTLHDFTIPTDYQRFLHEHDGSDGMDSAGWCFWGWSELRSITTLATEDDGHSIPPECHDPENYILFTDHLIHAGFLCFRVHRPASDTPVYYYFGFGALYPLARDWFDLHYAIEHENQESPFFDSLHQRCLAGTSFMPPPPPSIL
jgi:hypothetical protein